MTFAKLPLAAGDGDADPHQALRITRNLMAVGTSLLVILLLGVYRLEGYIAPLPFAVSIALILTLCAGFYLVFRSGLNLRFADPSLTMGQVAAAVATLVYVNFSLLEGRGAFLLVYIMAMLFAVFRLTAHQLLAIALPVIAAHATFIVVQAGQPAARLRVELLHLIVLAVVLIWFAQLGGYISGLRRRLRTLNAHDELTGAHSRRYILDILNAEKARADRYGDVFCVALLDLDHFKTINDRHGHTTGDEVLKAFSRVVELHVRGSDHFGRYGGEEFVLVLTRTNLQAGLPVVERIRAATTAAPWQHLIDELVVTVSIGMAEYRGGESIDALIQRTDAALYAAKRSGRDRVVTAHGGE